LLCADNCRVHLDAQRIEMPGSNREGGGYDTLADAMLARPEIPASRSNLDCYSASLGMLNPHAMS
jgi:hypothetical protein